MNTDLTLLVLGCGKMGGALIQGALKAGLPAKNVRIVEKSAEIRRAFEQKGIQTAETPAEFDSFCPDVVFVALKPFVVGDVLPQIKPFTDKGAAVLSIVAGKKIAFYEDVLGQKTPVVRAMPNTPALIGKGMTAACANAFVSPETKEAVGALLNACGAFAWVADESLIDAVTAVSGSGPAYLFYFVEALSDAALKAGLPANLCETFAKRTICGAAALLDETGESPAVLRQNVTTPNGTTAAALDVFAKDGALFALTQEAVAAAKRRSEELAK